MEENKAEVAVVDDAKKEKSQSAEQPRALGWKQQVALSAALSVVFSVLSLFAYDKWYAQKLVSVDMKGYVKLMGYKYGSGEIDDMKLRQAYDKMGQLVDSIPSNRAAISADVALRNVEPYKLGHEEELKQYEEIRMQLLRKFLSGQNQGQPQGMEGADAARP